MKFFNFYVLVFLFSFSFLFTGDLFSESSICEASDPAEFVAESFLVCKDTDKDEGLSNFSMFLKRFMYFDLFLLLSITSYAVVFKFDTLEEQIIVGVLNFLAFSWPLGGIFKSLGLSILTICSSVFFRRILIKRALRGFLLSNKFIWLNFFEKLIEVFADILDVDLGTSREIVQIISEY